MNLAKNCFIYLGVKIVFLALVTTVAADMFFSWVEAVLRRFQILLFKFGACSVSIATATFLLVH